MNPPPKINLGFSRKEIIGVTTLLSIILLLYIGAHFLRHYIKQPNNNTTANNEWLLAAATLQTQTAAEDSLTDYSKNNFFTQNTAKSYFTPPDRSLFYFNPNELSAEGWEKLGVKPKTINTIINYRNKGGKFRTAEDLKKIYGLSETDYAAIAPYVQIAKQQDNTNTTSSITPTYNNEKTTYPTYTKKSYHNIDINLSDTTTYISLPGIGSALAKRIVNFRDKLGGFYRVEQVGETYGVPDSTFQKIKPYLQANPAAIKKLNINSATFETLRDHPYIKSAIAKSIIAYRQQHGLFKNIDELKNIMSIDANAFEKIKHYVVINE